MNWDKTDLVIVLSIVLIVGAGAIGGALYNRNQDRQRMPVTIESLGENYTNGAGWGEGASRFTVVGFDIEGERVYFSVLARHRPSYQVGQTYLMRPDRLSR